MRRRGRPRGRRVIGACEAGQRGKHQVESPLATVLTAVGKPHDALAVPHAALVVPLINVAVRVRDLCVPVCGRRPRALLPARGGEPKQQDRVRDGRRRARRGRRARARRRPAQTLLGGLKPSRPACAARPPLLASEKFRNSISSPPPIPSACAAGICRVRTGPAAARGGVAHSRRCGLPLLFLFPGACGQLLLISRIMSP